MLGVGGFLAGVSVGFGLATALCRGYRQQLAPLRHAETDRQAAAAPPVAVPARDTPPTLRTRGRTARVPREPRRHPAAVTSAPSAAATLVGAPPPITDDITLPRAIVEQVYEQLARLDVLDRRASLRLVRRTDQRIGSCPNVDGT
jgi:hypothetical protein